MSAIMSFLGTEKMQKAIMGTIIGKFRKEGIKKVVVELHEDNSFDYSPIDENDIIVNRVKHEFLQSFYDNNKHLI